MCNRHTQSSEETNPATTTMHTEATSAWKKWDRYVYEYWKISGKMFGPSGFTYAQCAHTHTSDWSENNVANAVVTALNYKIVSCVSNSWLNFHIQHCVHVRCERIHYVLTTFLFQKGKKQQQKNPSLSAARSTTIDYLSHLCDSANPISNVWHAFNV